MCTGYRQPKRPLEKQSFETDNHSHDVYFHQRCFRSRFAAADIGQRGLHISVQIFRKHLKEHCVRYRRTHKKSIPEQHHRLLRFKNKTHFASNSTNDTNKLSNVEI